MSTAAGLDAAPRAADERTTPDEEWRPSRPTLAPGALHARDETAAKKTPCGPCKKREQGNAGPHGQTARRAATVRAWRARMGGVPTARTIRHARVTAAAWLVCAIRFQTVYRSPPIASAVGVVRAPAWWRAACINDISKESREPPAPPRSASATVATELRQAHRQVRDGGIDRRQRAICCGSASSRSRRTSRRCHLLPPLCAILHGPAVRLDNLR